MNIVGTFDTESEMIY